MLKEIFRESILERCIWKWVPRNQIDTLENRSLSVALAVRIDVQPARKKVPAARIVDSGEAAGRSNRYVPTAFAGSSAVEGPGPTVYFISINERQAVENGAECTSQLHRLDLLFVGTVSRGISVAIRTECFAIQSQ